MLLLEFVSQLLSFDQQRKVLLLEKDGSGLEAAGYQTPHRGYLSDGVQIQRKRAASLLNPDPFYELHLHATAALCSVWHPAVINTSAMNRVTVSNSNGAKWDTNKSVNRICFTSNRYFLATGEKYLWKWNIRSRCDSGLSYGWESTSVLPKHFFEPQLHFLRVHVEPVCSRFAHFFFFGFNLKFVRWAAGEGGACKFCAIEGRILLRKWFRLIFGTILVEPRGLNANGTKF